MSILSGQHLKWQLGQGNIQIDPFNEKQLNPVSYDLRLGTDVFEYEINRDANADNHGWPVAVVLDARQENLGSTSKISENGLVLWPGKFYLMHTAERIYTEKFVPVIDGKSSIGRLGIFVHVTAGFGDPGFDGQYTLEVVVALPVRIYPGMRIAQIRFHTIEGAVESYKKKGHYVGEASKGPVPSMSWKQFEEEKE